MEQRRGLGGGGMTFQAVSAHYMGAADPQRDPLSCRAVLPGLAPTSELDRGMLRVRGRAGSTARPARDPASTRTVCSRKTPCSESSLSQSLSLRTCPPMA